jgi:hypothetical protein
MRALLGEPTLSLRLYILLAVAALELLQKLLIHFLFFLLFDFPLLL